MRSWRTWHETWQDRCQISPIYEGPQGSANGGYACGLFAPGAGCSRHCRGLRRAAACAAAAVGDDDKPVGARVHICRADDIVASVSPDTTGIPLIAPVDARAAELASEGFRGRTGHPFPTCAICGSGRSDPAAQRLAPGPLAHRAGTVACTWIPRALSPESARRQLLSHTVNQSGQGWPVV